jgi:4-hydroxythreonine-4-phosphate dehydrogenase
MIVISTGCPAGIGPEISVTAAAEHKSRRGELGCVLVGDMATLCAAAEIVGVAPSRLVPFDPERAPKRGEIPVVDAGPKLAQKDRKPGKPTERSGVAQLEYVDVAYDLVKSTKNSVLVTAPVSKSVIAHSGAEGAEHFLGHTEWLEARDGAPYSVMCFALDRFSTSLVTTHLPISKVARAITPKKVAQATAALGELLSRIHPDKRSKIAVCSLNPHAGESSLLGGEEAKAIAPGIELAKKSLAKLGLAKRIELLGPLGAETAYRKANLGVYDGVVAMYHDQATIPMKLLAFGDAVNVTWGLGIIRTSVDHGTGYDIAWTGKASAKGMKSAVELAQRLAAATQS